MDEFSILYSWIEIHFVSHQIFYHLKITFFLCHFEIKAHFELIEAIRKGRKTKEYHKENYLKNSVGGKRVNFTFENETTERGIETR